MKEKLINGNLKVEEYSFHEFLSSFQEAVLEGYRLDLETNDNFPVKYGDFLTVVLVEAKPVLNANKEFGMATASAPEVAPPKRKAKASDV
jgi:hypothetical protein